MDERHIAFHLERGWIDYLTRHLETRLYLKTTRAIEVAQTIDNPVRGRIQCTVYLRT